MRYNAFGCSGLERYSLIPAFLAAAISSGSVLVLTAIMGIPGPSVWVEARIALAVCRPSMTGIWVSVRNRL